MGFVRPIVKEDNWLKVETSEGTAFVPASMFGVGSPLPCEVEEQVLSVEMTHGFGACLLKDANRTPWTVHETEEDARVYIRCELGVCPDCGADVSMTIHDNCGEDDKMEIMRSCCDRFKNEDHHPDCSCRDEVEEDDDDEKAEN